MAAYRNLSAPALWYDSSMLQGDETIFLFPRRHPSSAAAAPWYDCSMLQGDETIFLVPRNQSRRFVAANGHDRPLPLVPNQGFFQNRDASMIAEHIRSKLVVGDHRDGVGQFGGGKSQNRET